MLDQLPVEIVVEILRMTAELVRMTDVQTALNIARSCTIGYRSATPVIYRMISVNRHNADRLEAIFDEDFCGTGLAISDSPAQRLCPLVKTLFLGNLGCINSERIAKLVNLDAIHTVIHTNTLMTACSPTVTHCYILGHGSNQSISASVTHLSIYLSFHRSDVGRFVENYLSRMIPETVTHIAIEISGPVLATQKTSLHKIMEFLTLRHKPAPVIFRLYSDAIKPSSFSMVLCVIHALEPQQRQQVLLWRDHRAVASIDEDLGLLRRDAFDGKTPWTEATAVMEDELQAAIADSDLAQPNQ